MRSTSHFCSVAHSDWNPGAGVGFGRIGGGAGAVASHPIRQAPAARHDHQQQHEQQHASGHGEILHHLADNRPGLVRSCERGGLAV